MTEWWQWLIVCVVVWLILLITLLMMFAGITYHRASKDIDKAKEKLDRRRNRI